MPCPHCGFDVSEDFQFCPKCGKQLIRGCPKCSYVCPPEFLFCPRCGTKVSPEPAVPFSNAEPIRPVSPSPSPISQHLDQATTEAERRPVTVVFADVVEFTSLAEQLDPEELRSFLMGCFQTLAE